jgi:hypothetical protein
MFTHPKLKVYDKALVFAAWAEERSASWGRHPAMVDHFRRAAESLFKKVMKELQSLPGSTKFTTKFAIMVLN